jgi:hypothetical protein
LIPKGLFAKNSPWLDKHSIPHTTVISYGDCMEMCEDFTLKFVDKRTELAVAA